MLNKSNREYQLLILDLDKEILETDFCVLCIIWELMYDVAYSLGYWCKEH